MGSEKETLVALENLLSEFFDGNTTNERKRGIEEVLDSFSHQEGAWRQCIFFLSNSSNNYVHMYALSIFEKLVNQKWFGMQSQDKQEIRKFCTQFLVMPNGYPVFIKKKIAKVYVDIGRVDWPQFFPDFYHNILQFFRNESTIALGLTLLQITSEEFVSPREDLNNARKQELRTLLLEQAASTLEQIMHILDNIMQKLKLQANTITPPSSPRQISPFSSPCTSPTPTSSSTSHTAASTTNSMFNQNTMKHEVSGFLPTLDSTAEEIVLAALSCIHQFYTWIPLQNLISSNLVGKLFMFAGYGYTGTANGNSDHKANQIGTLAMGCINEIMSKNYFPAEYGSFLIKIFQQTFNLLQQLTKGGSSQLGTGTLARIDESYLEKFTEFLSLFVGIHLKRFEPESNFPTEELLLLLVKYTILQPTTQGFFHCLDIWTTFLDYLSNKINTCKSSNGMKENMSKKYAGALTDLLSKLLCKLQLRYNETQLEELDDDNDDDAIASGKPTETERGKFIRECLEIVAKIADVLPDEVVMKVIEVLQPHLDVYFGLASHISDHTHPGLKRLQLTSNEELQSLHICLRDLSTFLQTIGRLAHLFVGDENFNRKLADGHVIFERLCQTVMFGAYYKLYSIKNARPDLLNNDFINVHAHGIACLQAFSHWLELYQLESKRKNESEDKFRSFMVSILEGTLPLLQSTIPRRILLAAAHLLLSLNTTVRPQSFLTLEIVQKFYGTMGAGGLEALPMPIQVLISCSLSNAFVLPWPLVPQEGQEWEMRSSHHKCLINSFTKEYQHLPEVRILSTNVEERNRCKDYVKRICRILSGIIEAVSDQGTKSKAIVHQSTHEAIQIAANLFPVYLTHTDVAEEILGLLLVTIKNLKTQVGVVFVQHVIQQLLALLTRDQIAKIVEQNSENGYRVLEKFLKMLEFIVQEHDSSFKALIPGIIEFTLQQISPILRKYPASEVNTMVLELLHQLLQHNWRFFFKSNVISKMAGDDSMDHKELFVSIIKEIGQALMETDITLFKKSLEILQNLDEKYKLYHKNVFQSQMLSTFLQVLLNSLVSQSQDLLKEDIILTIHAMASVDLPNFNGEFMQHYLLQSEGLTDHQKNELLKGFQNQEDIPSFMAALQRFFEDYRYYRLINSSIPNAPLHL